MASMTQTPRGSLPHRVLRQHSGRAPWSSGVAVSACKRLTGRGRTMGWNGLRVTCISVMVVLAVMAVSPALASAGPATSDCLPEDARAAAASQPRCRAMGPDDAYAVTAWFDTWLGSLGREGRFIDYRVPGLGRIGVMVGPDRAIWIAGANQIGRLSLGRLPGSRRYGDIGGGARHALLVGGCWSLVACWP